MASSQPATQAYRRIRLSDVGLEIQIRPPTKSLTDTPTTRFYVAVDSVFDESTIHIPIADLRAHHLNWSILLRLLAAKLYRPFTDADCDMLVIIPQECGRRYLTHPIRGRLTFVSAMGILQNISDPDTNAPMWVIYMFYLRREVSRGPEGGDII